MVVDQEQRRVVLAAVVSPPSKMAQVQAITALEVERLCGLVERFLDVQPYKPFTIRPELRGASRIWETEGSGELPTFTRSQMRTMIREALLAAAGEITAEAARVRGQAVWTEKPGLDRAVAIVRRRADG